MNNNKSFTTIVNYLFIFLSINYILIVYFITKFDNAGYGLIFLSLLVLLLNKDDFQILQGQKPIVFWLLWCIFAFLNYYVHPHSFSKMPVFELYRKIFIPLIVLTVVTKEYKRNANGLLWLCFITHIMHLATGYFFDKGIFYRGGDEEHLLGNSYAIISSFSIFYMSLLNRVKKLSNILYIVLSIVVVVALSMLGTRKAFGAGLLMIMFWVLSLFELKKIWSWILVGVFFYFGILGYNYLMEYTFMGERMELLEVQQEIELPPDAPKFLQKFGDRGPHYYYGWQIFKSHPLIGVGANQANVKGIYIHTEYMAQLADNGIVGFSLFFLLYFWVIKRVLKKQKMNKSIGRCMLGGLVSILFLFSTAWGWCFSQYFICLGVLVGYCQNGYNGQNYKYINNNNG